MDLRVILFFSDGKNKVLNLIDFNKTIIDEIENYLNRINKIKDDTAQISNNLHNLKDAIEKSNDGNQKY